MARNGKTPGVLFFEMPSEELRALVVAAFELLAEREDRPILDVVDDCRDAIATHLQESEDSMM